jgi:uncharacterized cupredoxin-like copper-binding protein
VFAARDDRRRGLPKTSSVGLVDSGVAGAAVLSRCSSADTSAGEQTTSKNSFPGTVNVRVQGFAVIPDATSAPAGEVTFTVTNAVPDDDHEFVVVKTDLAPEALPAESNGSVDEAGKGIQPIDEIEDITVGDTQTVAVDLDAGSYVLMCNIYDKAEKESHYQQGMHTAFTVT